MADSGVDGPMLDPVHKAALEWLIANGQVEIVQGAERDGLPLYRLTAKGMALERKERGL